MARDIKITRITTTHFDYEIADMELEEQLGFDTVYRKGGRLAQSGGILTIETSAGVSGIAPQRHRSPLTAQYLLGRNPLDREIIWHDLKRSRRGQDEYATGRGGHRAMGFCWQTLRRADLRAFGRGLAQEVAGLRLDLSRRRKRRFDDAGRLRAIRAALQGAIRLSGV